MTVAFQPKPPIPETWADGATLVGRYFQTSRKHRLLARFPEVDGRPISVKDALRQGVIAAQKLFPVEGFDPAILQPHTERWVVHLAEDAAGDHFLSCYAQYLDGLELKLTREQFQQFRDAGGERYHIACALKRFK